MKWLLIFLIVLLSQISARAEAPSNWVFRWNRLLQSVTAITIEQLEEVATELEHQDYLRVSHLAASKLIDKDWSTWRATPLEREVVYGWILKLRIDAFNDIYYNQKLRGRDLDSARENVGIAYRRLARCENLHLWSRLAVLRGQEIAEGEPNIGYRSPVRAGLDLRWIFYTGGDPIGTMLDDYNELYSRQVSYRKPNILQAMWGVFTLRFLFTIPVDEDREVDLLKQHFYLEIDDATGTPLKLPELEKMAADERERIRSEIEAE